MTTVLRRINKRTYVFGLKWRDPGARGVTAARREALSLGASHLVIYRNLVGLGTVQGLGVMGGARSAATALCDGHAGNWLGAWPIGTDRSAEWWVGAGGKTGILPQGDQVFDGEAEAKAHFLHLLAGGTWSAIYAPPAWGVEKANGEILQARIDGYRGMALVSVRAIAALRWPYLAAAGGVALLAATAWLYMPPFWQSTAPVGPLPEPLPEPVAAEGAADPTTGQPTRPGPIAVNGVPLAASISACMGHEAHVFDARVPGWVLTGWTCTEKGMVAHLQPAAGRLHSAIIGRPGMRWRDQPGGPVDIEVPFAPAGPVQQGTGLMARDAALLQLRDVATALDLTIEFKPASAMNDPNRLAWSVRGTVPPDVWANGAYRAGPSELVTLGHTMNDLQFTIEGVTFVQP